MSLKIFCGVYTETENVMQIKIYLENPSELRLPMDYGYRLSSAVYRLAASDGEYSAFLHDMGYGEDGRRYKLFTYSPLVGHYRIEGRSIVFDGDISFEVRSISKRFCGAVRASLMSNGCVKLMDTVLRVKMVECGDNAPYVPEAELRTLSPIVVSSSADGKTVYCSPEDDRWEEMVNATLSRKFAAAYDTTPPSAVKLTLCGKPKKVVTRVKGIWVTAYHARFGLSAHPQVTAFLYETGIGSKNSQGFGMIELIDSPINS